MGDGRAALVVLGVTAELVVLVVVVVTAGEVTLDLELTLGLLFVVDDEMVEDEESLSSAAEVG